MIAGADVLRYALSTGGLTVLVLAIAIWVYLSSGSPRARRTLLFAAIVFVLISIYIGQFLAAQALVGSLRPFTAADAAPNRRTVIVVLGSGSVDVEDWDGRIFALPDRPAMARVLEASRVYRLIDPALIISSGGNVHPDRRTAPTAETMRDALVMLGVPANRIAIETQSRTTREEAVVVAPMLKAHGAEQVILVTSEEHMRRSLGTFRAVGVTAIPAIARDLEREQAWTRRWLPSDEGLGTASENAHEIIGTVYYALRGWWTWR